MTRMMILELKRVAKARLTWILAALALVLSAALALQAVSYVHCYYIDKNGREGYLSGMAAIQARREMMQPVQGLLTPEKIRTVFADYHDVYNTYGKNFENVPRDVFCRKIYPILRIVHLVGEVYIDKSTGDPLPVDKISPGNAADFYQQRTGRMQDLLAGKYPDNPDITRQALAMNKKMRTPFTYVYGIGDSAATDHMVHCIFLLAMIGMVIAAPVFSAEYQNGADDILRCAKLGRTRLAVVKLLSAVLLTAGLFAGCMTVFMLISYAAFGRDSLQTAMQAIQPAGCSAVSFAPLTVGDMNRLVLLSGLLSFLAMVCTTLFLSTKFKNPLTTLATGFGICLLPTILHSLGNGSGLENWLRLCLPSGGIGLGTGFYFELIDFNFLQLGPLNIWSPYIIPAAAGLEIILFFALAVRSYSRHEAA